MPDIKKMEGPVKFKTGVELYFDPKKDMFYDPKTKKYMSEKDILKLEEVEISQELNEELQTDFEKSSFLKAYKGVLKMNGKEVWTSLPAQYKSSSDAVKAAKHFKSLLDKHGYKMVSGSLEASDKAKKSMEDYDEKNAKFGKPSTTMGEETELEEYYHSKKKKMKEGRDEEYEKFFQSALKKFGVNSPSELKGDKKKEFFDYVDANWEGEDEEVEEAYHSKKKMKEDKEFKPHMMYDPKTGKAYKAEKPEDHERMSKLGYTHEKPEKIEELSIEEAKEWKVGAPVFIVISYHTNGKHSTTVLRTKEKAMKFAKDEEDHEDDVKGTAVLDMKVGKFINKETGKHIKEENIEEVKMHPALRKLETALKKFHKYPELDDLVPEYGAKIVDGKKVYHIEYKKGKKEGEEFAKSLQKALKASSFSVMPYRDGSMVSIEIKEEVELSEKMQKYVDACGKDFTNYSLKEGKKDYEIYHKTFTSAIEEVEKFAEKNGYEIDSDEMFNVVGTGPKRPAVGKTNKYHLTLMKNGKEDRKKLHFQVYGMKSQYELNMYIS